MKVSSALILLLGVAGHYPSMVMAQSPGTFTPTGNLTTARISHTATLLTNGKVLIAGGSGGYLPPPYTLWASAELYDPATGTFTATGSMTTSRSGHTATLLPDGKVLIAGGSTDGNFLPVASAELYDPATGTFTATGSMTTSRYVGHTATLLPNGKVLIAGADFPNGDTNVASAELYDPSTGTFTSTGQMTTGGQHRATLLTNGRVLLVGSAMFGSNGVRPGDEIYDPDTGTFSSADGSPYRYMWPGSASLLTNGKVLVTLSYADGPSDMAEVYDPSAGTFTASGTMTASRWDNTATLLPDDTVLIASLDDRSPWLGVSPDTAELYNPTTGTFSITGAMVTGRDSHTATLLPDGTVLMSGGLTCDGCEPTFGAAIASAEIYHPAVLVPSPVLYSLSGDGRGPGAILHADTHQTVSSSTPAVAGEALEVYGAGLIDGSVIPPQVAIGGLMAEVLFFGNAPGFAGLNQVNIRVPGGVAPGPTVSVRLTYLGRPSNEVTIGVR